MKSADTQEQTQRSRDEQTDRQTETGSDKEVKRNICRPTEIGKRWTVTQTQRGQMNVCNV